MRNVVVRVGRRRIEHVFYVATSKESSLFIYRVLMLLRLFTLGLPSLRFLFKAVSVTAVHIYLVVLFEPVQWHHPDFVRPQTVRVRWSIFLIYGHQIEERLFGVVHNRARFKVNLGFLAVFFYPNDDVLGRSLPTDTSLGELFFEHMVAEDARGIKWNILDALVAFNLKVKVQLNIFDLFRCDILINHKRLHQLI